MADITLAKVYERGADGKKRVLFYCDDSTAITALPTTAGVELANGDTSPIPMPGSEALQVDTGDRYVLDSSIAWVKQPDTAADTQAIRDYIAAEAACVLTIGAGTTVSLYSSGGVPFSSAVSQVTGNPLYKFDVILCTGETTVTGATNVAALGEHYYRVNGGAAVTVA
jgi:hypothetical protein